MRRGRFGLKNVGEKLHSAEKKSKGLHALLLHTDEVNWFSARLEPTYSCFSNPVFRKSELTARPSGSESTETYRNNSSSFFLA